jgi:hypothetical protein
MTVRMTQYVILTVRMTHYILWVMETRVTYRTSEETVKRLQDLSDKYGVSQSALLTMLVNQRWLSENSAVKKVVDFTPEPPPNFAPDYVQPFAPSRKRKRKRS